MAEGPLIRLAVFGNPVARSLSPRIHARFAQSCGLEIDYHAIEATSETFPAQLAELAAAGGRGCNVTAPLKYDAWRLAHRSSDTAMRAQAANTLVFNSGDDWFADSTDGPGLVADLASIPGCRLRGARICLLGAGGAAASVLGALLRAGPGETVIANRTQERAEDLARRHSDLGNLSVCAPDDLDAAQPFDLLINATSLGHDGSAPHLSASWLKSGGLCYDMNYGDAATPLRDNCRALDIAYSDGLGMLVGQAALSFKLWTNLSPDTSEVLLALRDATG